MRRDLINAIVAFSLGVATAAHAADDVLIADFEGEDYGQWKTVGEAFGTGPARGTLPRQMPVSGFKGERLVNSFFNGDDTTGTLTSPPFKIERRYINFLVGGGKHPGETCINLIVDGAVVRTATGPNDQPGGSEHLDWRAWDVSELLGKSAVIRIVDQRIGGWGHINVDHIVQSDEKRERAPAEREIAIERRYLHLPVKNDGAKCRMRFVLESKTVREFDIELAESAPDFWVFCDVSPFRGKKVRIEVDQMASDSKGLASIVQADAVPGADQLYQEKHRQQFHFSSRRGWNNDANGLVFYKGEYHLFYQHNPYGWQWGNMHWGHAVSRDLAHWEELPVAIYPHQFGDWAFSGSAAVDWNNTAGFKTGDNDVIVAAYTSTGRGESIAYSNDRGRTFTDYEGNPVVKHQGRDPKIIWYAPGKHWVMAVYDERDDSRGIAFYTSPDLKNWEYQSRTDGYHECPEIFEIPVDGDATNRKWVVYGGDGHYSIGTFDGKAFTKESGKHPNNYGNCFYASQTFNDVPPQDGRRIQIAWGRISTPGMPFNQCMLFPCELTLRTTDEGIRMFAEPVKEIEKIHDKKHRWTDLVLKPNTNLLTDIRGDLFHIVATFEVGNAAEFGLDVRGMPLVYDVKEQQIAYRECKAPLKPDKGAIRLEILVDRASVEIYGNGGRIYMPVGAIPPDDSPSLGIFTRGDDTRLKSLDVYELRSAWERSESAPPE